jgi:hypothetical protein
MERLQKIGPWVLVLLLLFVFVKWASADEFDWYIDAGVSQIADDVTDAPWFALTRRYAQANVDLTIGYIGPQTFTSCPREDCRFELNEQIYAGFKFFAVDPWAGRCEVSVGPVYAQNADRAVASRFRMELGASCRVRGRWHIQAKHQSNAGSSGDVTACNVLGDCFTNDWNTGQDSWLRVRWDF